MNYSSKKKYSTLSVMFSSPESIGRPRESSHGKLARRNDLSSLQRQITLLRVGDRAKSVTLAPQTVTAVSLGKSKSLRSQPKEES